MDKGKSYAVLTGDAYLKQKIRLELDGKFTPVEPCRADILLIDIDTHPERADGALTMSRRGEADISLPFVIGDLKRRLTEGEGRRLMPTEEGVMLDSRLIRLTEVELSLFRALYDRAGSFVSREELLSAVWGEGAGASILNVYIHYLREKLESGGEKIILSSRGEGYKIDEKFTGGAVCCE